MNLRIHPCTALLTTMPSSARAVNTGGTRGGARCAKREAARHATRRLLRMAGQAIPCMRFERAQERCRSVSSIASGRSGAAACDEAGKCRCSCREERSFERKPLFECALGPAAEFRHRTGHAVKEPFRPTVRVDRRCGRNRRGRHNNRDICIRNVHVDAQVQPAVLCRARPGFDGLARHTPNVPELLRSIQRRDSSRLPASTSKLHELRYLPPAARPVPGRFNPLSSHGPW